MSTKAITKIGFIVDDKTWNNGVDCEQVTNDYVIIKPNETLEVSSLRIVTSDSTTSYTLKTMVMEYQQGMENWDIPYFQGMQSVTMTTELDNVCSRYNSGVAKNGKTFTVGTARTRYLELATLANISNYNFILNNSIR